ncbi:hypothetical protein CC78DRAFT_613181 [Lojkania enalia]|uniref:DNA polymerase V n=1 Tax=Lojkania enalia TaxID=147567 RepID=A0A9P4KGS2_9PLEO|nr:hypothetical protein CC78DRAFT_613181 [Didymosphaeria enalia]
MRINFQMGGIKTKRKSLKREREVADENAVSETPPKRFRPTSEDHVSLVKLYEDLAAESDEIRLEAAKKLILRFSPENNPSPKAIKQALDRLIRGLCSHRKAARFGFCVTLTELLRQLFGPSKITVPDLDLDVSAVIELVNVKTKVDGNVPGQERRDHLIGKLFGFKAIMQSSTLIEPELLLENWNQVLDHIYELARDVPWLREECGLVLCEAIKSLKSLPSLRPCAQEVAERLSLFKLVNTPEGVAIWLTVRANYDDAVPDHIWHRKDPLSKKERSRLAKILREDFNTSKESADEVVKSAAANPNPIFAWDLVLTEILRRDERRRSEHSDDSKSEFSQVWRDLVDENLFSSTASHERKSWGFKLFIKMITTAPIWALSALFSPNLMRTMINQVQIEDRLLHATALAALKSVQLRAQRDPGSAIPIITGMTSEQRTFEFDKHAIRKTLEQTVLAADDQTLRQIVRHFRALVLRPKSQDQASANIRRQSIADILLNIVKSYPRYATFSSVSSKEESWLRDTLELFVEISYFTPSKNAKTNQVPLPPIDDANRDLFRERLSSCLTRLLRVEAGDRASFALLIANMVRSKAWPAKTLEPTFKADKSIINIVERSFEALDSLASKGSIDGKRSAADSLVLLYSLALLQVFNGDGDAVLMLDDLDSSRKSLLSKDKKSSGTQAQNTFVELILTFLGNPRNLFRRIAEEAFTIFTADITPEGLQSLTSILDTAENLEGQRELFEQGSNELADEVSSEESLEVSDVDLVSNETDEGIDDGNGSSKEGSESGSNKDDESPIEDGSGGEDEEELARFNELLAQTLQTSQARLDGAAADDSSNEEDMDDEQMMALDPHLTKIFQQRRKTSKEAREEAKQMVVRFKSRILDLLSIYLDKEYSNPLSLEVIIPMLRRIRANANRQLTEKSNKILITYFDTRKKHKGPLPKPENQDAAWKILNEIHEEAKMGGKSTLHATACSSASLHLVKILVGLDRSNYSRAVDVYSESQKQWFMNRDSGILPILFTKFHSWSTETRNQRK